MDSPQQPVRPSSIDALDHFVSWVMALRRICKADQVFFDEMAKYITSETERLGTLWVKVRKEPSDELIQEIRNLDRRLSIMSLFLQFLKLQC